MKSVLIKCSQQVSNARIENWQPIFYSFLLQQSIQPCIHKSFSLYYLPLYSSSVLAGISSKQRKKALKVSDS